jgi:hypothetical protein
MSLIQLALEKQQYDKELLKLQINGTPINQNAIRSNNTDRIEQIKAKIKNSIEMMPYNEFIQAYRAKHEKSKRNPTNEQIRDFVPYEKEKLLRDKENITSTIPLKDLTSKDLPIELERIERDYIRRGFTLDDIHTSADPDAIKYKELRQKFKAELDRNSERWGWWQDWKDPRYNRYRKGGKQTAKKFTKNNKTKKSTRRSS